MSMRKPRALQPGDHIAVVAPASAFSLEEFHAGLVELTALGGRRRLGDAEIFSVLSYES